MNQKINYNTKGFTLVEMMVIVAIISILAAILVPSMLGYIRRARIAAAISDARTIRTTVENALVEEFQYKQTKISNPENAFDKQLYHAKNNQQLEYVGCFTNTSWFLYKDKLRADGTLDTSGQGEAQKIDMAIARGLDARFGNENWKKGANSANPLPYCYKTGNNCNKYLNDKRTNFGLAVMYDSSFNVIFMQIYRKGILVSYVNGEYIANDSKEARFVGTNYWSTIYEDVGKEAPEGIGDWSIGHMQKRGKTGWI